MKKKKLEPTMKYVFFVTALTAVIAVFLICIFLFSNGIPTILRIGIKDFFLGETWRPTNTPPEFGILPMILGSIYVTIGAIIIGVPFGILTAIFITKFCNNKIAKGFTKTVELLAGIPSVVLGFFGIIVLVPFVREVFGGTGFSMLTASVLLGIMILPTVVSVSVSALNAVPVHYYEGALALGATKERAIFSVVLPAAKSGVFASVVLGIGRAIGETMAVVMVAGNQARIPRGLLRGVRTMTSNIVIEMGYASGIHKDALIATGVALFVFILIINITFLILVHRGERKR